MPQADNSRDEIDQWLGLTAQCGLDHVFGADHVSFRGGFGFDGIAQMAFLLGAHRTLKACVGVYLLALRHPTLVARQLSTISELAPGRLILGVGVGGEDRAEMWSVGVDPATRGRRTDEYLEVLAALSTGESITYDGEFTKLDSVAVIPAPEPRVPVLIGGRSNAALARAGRFADGWLGAWCSVDRFERATAVVADAAAEHDRSVAGWSHGMQLWVGVGDSKDEARGHVQPAIEAFYGVAFSAFERYTPVGTPADIADFMAPYVDAGADMLNLTPIAGNNDEGVEAIGEVKRLLSAR